MRTELKTNDSSVSKEGEKQASALVYSHGFEEIYSLQSVDPKTIRTFGSSPGSGEKKQTTPTCDDTTDFDEMFDFGYGFRTWIEPFFLSEPLQVLNLPKHVLEALFDSGYNTLGDLVGQGVDALSSVKGVGLGHADEIVLRLNNIVNGRSLKKARTIDLTSWIKTLVLAFDRKMTFVLLEDYGLESLISLTTGEQIEVKRLTLEKRGEWVEEAKAEVTSKGQAQKLISQMEEVAKAFILPWIRSKGGVVASYEVEERMLRHCLDPSLFEKAFTLFSDILRTKDPFSLVLSRADTSVYAGSAEAFRLYQETIHLAKSYFSKGTPTYLFVHLVSKINHTLCMSGALVPEGFVVDVFSISSQICRFKDEKGKGMVALVPDFF